MLIVRQGMTVCLAGGAIGMAIAEDRIQKIDPRTGRVLATIVA